MREISILKQRILEYLEKAGVSKYECYKNTGITNGVLSQGNGMSEDNLLKFLSYYSDIDHTWLLTGRGSMLREEQQAVQTPQPADDSLLYTMYKEERIENKALTEEIGALKLTIRQQEEKIAGLQQASTPFQEDSTGSARTRKRGVVESGSARFAGRE